MQTRHFGTVAQIEVGALLVGRICNHDGAGAFTRGAEKGCFYYGGSTVVLLLQKGDTVEITPQGDAKDGFAQAAAVKAK